MVNHYSPGGFATEWSQDVSFAYGFLGYKDPRIDAEYNRFVFRDLTGVLLSAGLSFGDVLFPWLVMRFQLHWLIVNLTEGALLLTLATCDLVLHLFASKSSLKINRIRHFVTLLLALIGIFNNTSAVVSQFPRCAVFADVVQLFGGAPFDSGPISIAKRCRDINNLFVVSVYMIVLGFIRLRFHEVVFLCPVAIGAYYLGYVDPPPPAFDQPPLVKGLVFFLTHVVGCVLAISIAWVTDSMRRGPFEQSVLLMQSTLTAQRRQREVESLLSAMVADSVLEKLAAGQSTFSAADSATVLFSDIAMFTRWSSTRSPQQVVAMLNVLVPAFDELAQSHGVEKVKTIGDAYWAVTGLPDPVSDHAPRMLRFAFGMQAIVKRQNAAHREWSDIGIRVGVHSGPLCGAVLGSRAISYEVFGDTSAVAEEVEKAGIAGQVCCSIPTADLICPDDGFEFIPHMQINVPEGGTLPIVHVLRAVASSNDLAFSILDGGLASSARSQPASSVGSTRDSSHLVHKQFLDSRQRHVEPSMKTATSDRDLPVHAQSPGAASKWMVGEDDVAIDARYAERRFSWIVPCFLDGKLEDEFLQWAQQRHTQMRRIVRGLAVGAFAAMMIALAIERPAAVPVSSIVLFVVGGLAVLASLALALWNAAHRVDELASVVGGACSIVAAGLIPYSVIGNDVTYAALWFSALFSLGSSTLPAVVRAGLVQPFFLAPAIAFASGSPVFALVVLIALLLMFFSTLFSLITDRSFRSQFKEETKAEYFRAQVVTAAAQQRVLLETVVPTHVIPELLEWLRHSLSPQRSIVRVVPDVCVAFVTLRPRHPAAVGHAIDASWLMAAHTQVDDHLGDRAAFTVVEKVKTVGDVVLLAGPLDASAGGDAPVPQGTGARRTLVACRELCAAVARIREGSDVHVGFHVGEVVGAVVGSTRLTFDIFGDCVNVASRMMTLAKAATSMGGASTGIASDAFCRLHSAAPQAEPACIRDALSPPAYDSPYSTPTRFVFGPAEERAVKGKGTLTVRAVVHWGDLVITGSTDHRTDQ